MKRFTNQKTKQNTETAFDNILVDLIGRCWGALSTARK
jgi:hypothetical protein